MGHIEGATFAENLSTFGTIAHEGAAPADFSGCEFCTIAVYCRKFSMFNSFFVLQFHCD